MARGFTLTTNQLKSWLLVTQPSDFLTAEEYLFYYKCYRSRLLAAAAPSLETMYIPVLVLSRVLGYNVAGGHTFGSTTCDTVINVWRQLRPKERSYTIDGRLMMPLDAADEVMDRILAAEGRYHPP